MTFYSMIVVIGAKYEQKASKIVIFLQFDNNLLIFCPSNILDGGEGPMMSSLNLICYPDPFFDFKICSGKQK